MLRSAFRLGFNSPIGINLTLTRALAVHSGRRPVKILNDTEESPPIEMITEESTSHRKKSKKSDVYRHSKFDNKLYIKSEVNEDWDEPSTELDGYPRPPWNRELNDLKLSKYMVSVKSKNQRRKEGITLLEGKRLISDALLGGIELKAVFVSKRTAIQSLPLPPSGYTLHWIPYKYFSKWTDVTTSSGVLAIAKIPATIQTAPDPDSLPLTVICDNIKDPGNMGAILRVLAAVGCRKILITKGCVDIWSPKVLRAGAGGHFRVPIEYDVDWENVNSLLEGQEEASVYLADSMNITGNNTSKNTELESSDSDQDTTTVSERSAPLFQKEESEETSNTVDKRQILQALPYYNLQFNVLGQNILVISNESFGPSHEAVDFASSRNGVKIHIPLCGKVESLNVASALSVIAFEMKRQMSIL